METTETEPSSPEITGPQTGGGAALGVTMSGHEAPRGKLNTYRQMLTDDTIALGMAIVKAPIVAAGYSFACEDDAPEGAHEFIDTQISPIVKPYKGAALRALSYGWAPWEKVFGISVEGGVMRVVLSKLKPLLHDITKIGTDRDTGQFAGFRQSGQQGEDVTVPLESSLLFTHDREGDNHYGRPRLENSRLAWHQYRETAAGAARYDRKIAGAWVVVHYPKGNTRTDKGDTPNFEVAKELAAGIEASKPIVIQNEWAKSTGREDKVDATQWKIEVLSDSSSKQSSFGERLNYLDKKKLRGLFVPERAAMEGTGGTKADAESHADIIIATAEDLYGDMLETLQKHVIDQLLELNFGKEARGTVKIEPTPMIDRDRDILVEAFRALLSSPGGFEYLSGNSDLIALLESLGVPLLAEGDREDQPGLPGQTGPGEGSTADAARMQQLADAAGAA